MTRSRHIALFFCSLLAILCGCTTNRAALRSHQPLKAIQIKWLGHAAFEVTSSTGTKIIIDPWLQGNPSTPAAFQDLKQYHPAAIIVTHSHFDHSSDAVLLAKQSGAPIIAVSDWTDKLDLPEKQKIGCNVGGTIVVGDITVHVVPAMHSSEPSGRPVGFVLSFSDGRSLYDTGDTWVFGDMALIQELYHPAIILLNVGGGHFGSDPKTAAFEVNKYLNPETIIPMHYGTFPGLETEADVRAAFAGDKRLGIMIPGKEQAF